MTMIKNVFIAALAALAPLAAAQLAGLPECAGTAGLNVLGGNGVCQATDFACICKNPAILSSLQATVQDSCTDPADISSGIAAASSICAPYGGFVPASSATVAAVPASTTPGGPAVTATSGSASTSTFSSATVTAPYGAGNTSSAMSTTGGAGSANKTGAGSPVVTGAAIKDAGVPALRDAGLLAGVIAFIGVAVMM